MIMRAFLLSLCLVSLCASSNVVAESAAGIRWTAPAFLLAASLARPAFSQSTQPGPRFDIADVRVSDRNSFTDRDQGTTRNAINVRAGLVL